MFPKPAVVHSLSVDLETTSEDDFFSSISLVLSRAAYLELGPTFRVPFHKYLLCLMALPRKSYMYNEKTKKQLNEGQEDDLVSLLVGQLTFQRTSQLPWPLPQEPGGQFSPGLALPRAGRHKLGAELQTCWCPWLLKAKV